MPDFLQNSAFFAVFLTLAAFELARVLQQKFKSPLLNPILWSAILIALVLTLTGVPNASYQQRTAVLSYLLTPATICFAIPFYQRLRELRPYLWVIILGTLAGTTASLASIAALSSLFGLEPMLLASLLPKSITTAIGVVLSEQAGGLPALTTAAIILTGVGGNLFGPWLSKLFRLREPIAQGVAYGTASHAIGTSKAMEIDRLAGAVSGFALTLAGLITAVVFSFLFQ